MELHCAYDQLVRVSDLKPHPKTPNTHSAAQVAAIAAVIEGNGWRAPVTVSNRSGFITRGHGRLEAATLLQFREMIVCEHVGQLRLFARVILEVHRNLLATSRD